MGQQPPPALPGDGRSLLCVPPPPHSCLVAPVHSDGEVKREVKLRQQLQRGVVGAAGGDDTQNTP